MTQNPKHQGHRFSLVTKGATTHADAIINANGDFEITGPTEIIEYDGDQYPWCDDCEVFLTEEDGLSDSWLVLG